MKHPLTKLLDVERERLQTAGNALTGVEFEQWKIDRLNEAIQRQCDRGRIYSGEELGLLSYRRKAVEFFRANLAEIRYES